MRLSSLFSLAVVSTLAFSFGSVAHATNISAVGSSVVANGGIAPGSASNYDFFGTGQVNLTNYTVSPGNVATASGFFGAGNPANYNQIIAPGGSSPFFTGLILDTNSDAVNFLLATFTATTSGDFYVYILDGNSDGNVLGNANVSLGVNGGTAVSIDSAFTGRNNEFSQFLVTGATAGDTFQIYATAAPGDRAAIGGITFADISPVPEPGSLMLSLTGMGSAFVMARKRWLS